MTTTTITELSHNLSMLLDLQTDLEAETDPARRQLLTQQARNVSRYIDWLREHPRIARRPWAGAAGGTQ